MNTPMKIYSYAKIFSATLSYCCNSFQNSIHFFIAVDHLKFFRCIHLNCRKSSVLSLFCCTSHILRTVSSNPRIYSHTISAFSAHQLIHWSIKIFTFDIPKSLINACNCTHQDTAAPVKSSPVKYIKYILNSRWISTQ